MMKFIICFNLCLFLFVRCENTFSKDNSKSIKEIKIENIVKENNRKDRAVLKIIDKKKDFGTISKVKTDRKSISFDIENTGTKPLIIYNVDVACGCLSVDIPKEPILSGEKSIIKVHIDIRKVEGQFNKVVYIKSNAINDLELIRIKGFVKK